MITVTNVEISYQNLENLVNLELFPWDLEIVELTDYNFEEEFLIMFSKDFSRGIKMHRIG